MIRPFGAGHVEFFREAAAYGDLYVRLGSSANIKMLKNHDTMYNDAERLFMVQNLKSVHDAAISLGSGASRVRGEGARAGGGGSRRWRKCAPTLLPRHSSPPPSHPFSFVVHVCEMESRA